MEEALQSLTEDVTKELAEAIATLQKYQSTDEDYSSYESALDIIADRVDNIDCANGKWILFYAKWFWFLISKFNLQIVGIWFRSDIFYFWNNFNY